MKLSYAKMTGDSGAKPFEVKVFKKDKSPFTREDQWSIQFGITSALLDATQKGLKGDQVAHNGTRLAHRSLLVFCAPPAGNFYKDSINNIPGFEAYLPGEHTPGHEIYVLIPGMAAAILPRLNEHFAAGSFGAVKASQVRISRKAWRPAGSNGSFHVYLEVDDEAFEWLRSTQWMSSIGLFVARWEHPPVKGIRGYIRPDQDIKLLREQLARDAGQSASNADNTLVPEESNPIHDIRSRHITGENKEAPETEELAEEHTLLQEEVTEENRVFATQLTKLQAEEFLKVATVPTASSTPTRRTREETDTSPPGRSGKLHRRTKSNGDPATDPSDSEH